jgi:tetratricopeptide (TPR) repeat protein
MTLRQHIGCYCIGAALTLLPSGLCQTPAQPVNFVTSHSLNPVPAADLTPELRGDLLAARQRYLDAIAAYRQGPPDSAVLANKIGVAYHHMFDVTDAKKYYERAIQLNPHYAEAINNLGAFYHSQKNYRQAEKLYRRAIKIDPKSPLFYSNLGTAYFFQGNAKKGAEAYRQAFALDPEVFERTPGAKIEESSSTKDLAQVNYTLAKTYAQAGMNDRALAYLRKAVGEGFSDRKKLMTDREFASMRETPEFLQLLSMQEASR